MSFEAKSIVIALNLEVLEQLRAETEEKFEFEANKSWFQMPEDGILKFDILRTRVL